jgi:membrane-associated protease RseP (regulator of RpoE activity)
MIPAHATEEVAEPPSRAASWARLAGVLALLALVAVIWSWQGLLWVLLLIVSVFLHELGHYLAGKRGGMKVTEFFIGFGPRLWSVRRGETEYGVKAIPLGAYVKTPGMTNLEEVPPADEPRTYRAQSYGRRARMVLAGPLMNLAVALLGFCVFFGAFPERAVDASTIDPVDGNPAALAGLELGDSIVAIDGKAMDGFDDIAAYVRARPDETVTVSVRRDGSTLDVPVTLGSQELFNGDTIGFLGVARGYTEISRNPLEGVQRGFEEFGYGVGATVASVADIFSPSGLARLYRFVTGEEADDPSQRPTSIVGVSRIGERAVRSGVGEAVYVLAAVNLALGLINLLPLLPLDGGHLVVATYERIRSRRGRPYHADFSKVIPAFSVAIVALVFVMVSSIWLDVVNG